MIDFVIGAATGALATAFVAYAISADSKAEGFKAGRDFAAQKLAELKLPSTARVVAAVDALDRHVQLKAGGVEIDPSEANKLLQVDVHGRANPLSIVTDIVHAWLNADGPRGQLFDQLRNHPTVPPGFKVVAGNPPELYPAPPGRPVRSHTPGQVPTFPHWPLVPTKDLAFDDAETENVVRLPIKTLGSVAAEAKVRQALGLCDGCAEPLGPEEYRHGGLCDACREKMEGLEK